jgi:hypothetical protein
MYVAYNEIIYLFPNIILVSSMTHPNISDFKRVCKKFNILRGKPIWRTPDLPTCSLADQLLKWMHLFSQNFSFVYIMAYISDTL